MIIVNFSTKEYRQGQQRLAGSIKGYPSMMYTDYSQIHSPTHQESPYAFKPYTLATAKNIDPIVLWVDASMYQVGDLSKIEEIIKRDGYFMEEAGHYAGRWTNQHTRDYFKVTDQEMVQGEGGITMFSAGLLGLDFNSALATDFNVQWSFAAIAGCFKGDWTDHRHDMTCGSIIASRLGMKYQRGGSHLAYVGPGFSTPEPGVVFLCQGIV